MSEELHEIRGRVSGVGGVNARVGTVGQVGGRVTFPVYQPSLEDKTVTPTKQTQTVEVDEGYDALGSVQVEPIPDNYYDMSGPMSWLGKDAECVDDSVFSVTKKLKDTGFNGWTPSTTALIITASAVAKTFEADLENYEYYIVWECKSDMDYTGQSPTLKAHFLFSRCYMVQQINKRPASYANILANIFDGNVCSSIYTSNFLRYYGTTAGSVTYTWSQSYGIYFGATAATFSSSTSNTPTVTIKTPSVSARCSTTYFSTGNAAKVNKDNSGYSIAGKLYRVKKKGIIRSVYDHVVDLINA